MKRQYRYGIWIGLFLALDLIFCLCLWLMEAQAFAALSGIIFLGTAVLLLAAVLISQRAERKRLSAFERFAEQPDMRREEELLLLVSEAERGQVRQLGVRLRELEQAVKAQEVQRLAQEEYVELWAHEIKNALSLMTFLLDNRKEEMSETVYGRMEHIRDQVQEYVNQMLYYERLEAVHKDYVFEEAALKECCTEVLGAYRGQLLEQNMQVEVQLGAERVCVDRKGLEFLLGQAVSNAVKYAGNREHARLVLVSEKAGDGKGILLRLRDNGPGVRACDLPFLFDKGFVGDCGDGRKKATGMGLYLLKRMADDLNIRAEAESVYGEGFELILTFPEIKKK